MYFNLDIPVLFTIILLIYIIVDFIRKGKKNIVKRLVFYSFIFYMLNVFQVTTGGLNIPPYIENGYREYWKSFFQLVPFRFVIEWIDHYHIRGLDWFFWNSVKLSFYNFIMLFPLGVYLHLLFEVKSWKRALKHLFFTSLTIEVYQIIFSYTGLIMSRSFNVDDLILNTLGGMMGYFMYAIVKEKFLKRYAHFK